MITLHASTASSSVERCTFVRATVDIGPAVSYLVSLSVNGIYGVLENCDAAAATFGVSGGGQRWHRNHSFREPPCGLADLENTRNEYRKICSRTVSLEPWNHVPGTDLGTQWRLYEGSLLWQIMDIGHHEVVHSSGCCMATRMLLAPSSMILAAALIACACGRRHFPGNLSPNYFPPPPRRPAEDGGQCSGLGLGVNSSHTALLTAAFAV